MTEKLNLIVVDDDPLVCEILVEMAKRFYTWGDILIFNDYDRAVEGCMALDEDVALFIVDVYLGGQSGFCFLDEIEKKFPSAYEDSIIITGNAGDDVVNVCLAQEVHYLLEKPIKPYAFRLAVKSLVTKYLKFGKKILEDPSFRESVARFKSLSLFKM